MKNKTIVFGGKRIRKKKIIRIVLSLRTVLSTYDEGARESIPTITVITNKGKEYSETFDSLVIARYRLAFLTRIVWGNNSAVRGNRRYLSLLEDYADTDLEEEDKE